MTDLKDILEVIEQHRQGFYLGCRVEPHSPQVNEFVKVLVAALIDRFETGIPEEKEEK